jgi:hypothetical protein
MLARCKAAWDLAKVLLAMVPQFDQNSLGRELDELVR